MTLKIRQRKCYIILLIAYLFLWLFLRSISGQSTIYVQGTIPGDTTWSADTVKVTGDVTVNGTLTIEPGTYVEFQGHYQLKVKSLQAIGTATDSIIFTINDTTSFHDFSSTDGGWNGIYIGLGGSLSSFEYCKIKYGKTFGDIWYKNCNIITADNSKLEIKNSDLSYNYSNIGGGGVIVGAVASIKIKESNISNNLCSGISSHYSDLEIDSCVITNNDGNGIIYVSSSRASITNNIISSNNGRGISTGEPLRSIISGNYIAYNKCGISIREFDVPENGLIFNNIIAHNSPEGGIYMKEHNYPIVNNIICNNISNSDNCGGGITLSLSNPKIINNTILNNSAPTGGGLWIISHGEEILNCIFRGNFASQSGNQFYFYDWFGAGDNPTFNTTISNCNIEGGKKGFGGLEYLGKYDNNIDEIPYFLDPQNGNYSLTDSSPCINAGTPDTTGLNLPEFDFAGNPRISDLTIDMGAYEYYSDSLKIILQPVNESKCVGDSVTLVTNAVGGVIGYQWQKEGIDIPGACNRFLVMDSLRPGDAGNYNCIIEGISGTTSTDTVKLSILNIYLGNDTTLCPGQSIMLDGGDQAETYLWSNGSVGRYCLVDTSGVYWLEATNSIGCVSSDTITVSYLYPFNEELAFVTYDNTTGKNIIVWNKTPDSGTKNYIIYKAYEDNYLSLDTISYNEENYLMDDYTDLPGFSNKYALTTIDICENESIFDNPHRLLHISGYVDLSKGLTLSIEEYQGIYYDKYYIFRGSDPLSLELADSINHAGFYTSYSEQDYPYNETYYQAWIKLPENYIININGSEREFSYSLSNLYFKPRNNTAPYDIILSNNRIDENLPEGTEVGIISALDYDLEDHHTFHLVSGQGDSDNNNFQIIDDKLIAAVSFNFENTAEKNIRIRAVDDGPANLFYEKAFKIYINDIIESSTLKHIYNDEIFVMPNPVKESASIEFPNEKNDSYTLYLKDIAGNVIVIYGNITSGFYELHRGDLPPGLYFLELSNNNTTYRTKIILE